MSAPAPNGETERLAAPARDGVALGPPPFGRAAPRRSRPARRAADSPLVLAAAALKLVAVVVWFATQRHALAAFLFFGGGSVVVYHLLVPSANGLGRVFTRFRTKRKEIWLTIDDGPDPADTPAILNLLDRYGARATFFVVGRRAEQHPGLVAEIVRRGHEIGHHTHTHPVGTFWCATRNRVAAELENGLAILAANGVRPRFFRAPVGIKNIFLARELARRGLACIAWTVRSGDCLSADPARIVARVLQQLQPGAIILMHEGPSVPRPVRVRAIAQLLAALSARQFTCVIPAPDQLR